MDDINISQQNFLSKEKPEYLYVKMNNSQAKNKEIKVKLSQLSYTIDDFIKEDIIKKHMNTKKNYPLAQLYQKNGVALYNDDLQYLKTGDTVYFSRQGESFNYQQIMDKYEKIKKIGEGGFGRVFLMRDKEKNDNEENLVAVKFIKLNDYMQKADGVYEIDREAKTLRMPNSKYIVRLESYFVVDKEIVLVMEYCQGGELKQYLHEKGILPEIEVRSIINQIIQGVQACHSQGIIHRDLKLENVLFLNEDKKLIKIVDFGIAGFCLNNLKEKTDAGTFKYMAPEVLKGEISLANPGMDVWSIGMMMFLMLYGFHPFLQKNTRYSKNIDLKDLIQRIIMEPLDIPQPTYQEDIQISDFQLSFYKEEKKEIPIVTQEAQDLLKLLLNKNSKDRISLYDAFQHQWFQMSNEDIQTQHLEIQQNLFLKNQKQKEINDMKLMNKITKKSSMQQSYKELTRLQVPKKNLGISNRKSTLTPMGLYYKNEEVKVIEKSPKDPQKAKLKNHVEIESKFKKKNLGGSISPHIQAKHFFDGNKNSPLPK